MKNEIVKIDPKEFGLEVASAEKITKGLTTILKEKEILSGQYSKVIKLETTKENISAFRELRLQIRNNRTKGIEMWHKTNKEYFLRGGQFVDAIKRKESEENIRMEEQLLKGEKHFENLETERKAKLKTDREKALEKYEVETEHIQLGEMAEDVWLNYFNGVKLEYDGRIAAKIKAEEERIAKEKAEREEQERIQKENERLKKEAKEKEAKAEQERKRIEAEKEKKVKNFNAILIKEGYKENEEKDAFFQTPHLITKNSLLELTEGEFQIRLKQGKDIISQNKKLKAAEEKARIEAEAKAKIEAELQAQKDKEAKAEQEKQAAIEAELSKGDKEKFQSIISDLTQIKEKYTFKSKKFCTLQGQINELIDKIITFTNSKI